MGIMTYFLGWFEYEMEPNIIIAMHVSKETDIMDFPLGHTQSSFLAETSK